MSLPYFDNTCFETNCPICFNSDNAPQLGLPVTFVYLHINRSSGFQLRCSTDLERYVSKYPQLTISQFI